MMFKRKSSLKTNSTSCSLFQRKKYIDFTGLLFMFCFIFNQGEAQNNLVPNPSFEQYTNCPSAASLDEYKNSKPNYWYKPDLRGAAYLNACADTLAGVPIHSTTSGEGFQYARTGVAYVGMFYKNGLNRRNYFQVQLRDSLEAGKCYYAAYCINESNRFEIACNNQSILLTNTPVYADKINKQIILANPQVTNYNNEIITDTLNWIKVSGVFIAQGSERYLTIGNFRDDNHTRSIRFQPQGSSYDGAAYHVDDVSLYALDSMPLKADAGPDTTIAIGNSVFIGSLTNGIPNIQWYDMSGNVIDTGRPGFVVHPATTTSYVIVQTVCGYYSRDTVTVMVNLLPLKWLGFTGVAVSSSLSLSAPATSGGEGRGEVLLKWQTASEFNVSHYNIQRSFRGADVFENIGQVAANNRPFNEYSFVDDGLPPGFNGRVLYRIQSIDKDGMRSYSVVRSVLLNGKEDELKVYPNPARQVVNIAFPKMKEVTIVDAVGRVVLRWIGFGQHQLQMNIGQLTSGMYAVKVDNGDRIVTTKLLVK